MGKIGPTFSHLLTVSAKGLTPPPHPYGQPDRKKTVVFFTTSLLIVTFKISPHFDLINIIEYTTWAANTFDRTPVTYRSHCEGGKGREGVEEPLRRVVPLPQMTRDRGELRQG